MSEQNLLVLAGSVPAPNMLRCASRVALASARSRYSAHLTAHQTKIPKTHYPSTFAA
jgi:hypothetical protein